MNHLSFCRWIDLPQPALDCIAALSMPDYPELRALFERDVKAFQQEVRKYPDWRQRFLWLYTRLGSEAVDRLMAQGVSEQILRDTFYDQVIWYENCVRKYGEPGLAQYDWLWWPIKGLMFRLGRLQFHPVALEEELRLPTITLPKGAIVLNTHIPQGEPLDFDAAQASFAQAIRFFRGANPVFVCHSWLLEPALKQLLKEFSRYHGLPKGDAIFFNQTDLLCEMARKESFIIMGRCADVILTNNRIPHISIYIDAPFEMRVRRVMKTDELSRKAAIKLLKKLDRQHRRYNEFYTGYEWGNAVNYDLCINSAAYGIQGSVELIERIITQHTKKNND